ncbi:MAG: hypothetical protein AAGJ92_09070, partial [Pseudomonadota bacterium]
MTFPAWQDVAADLVAVAAGRAPADLVIRGGRWVNVHSREVLAGVNPRYPLKAAGATHTALDAALCVQSDNTDLK